MQGFNYNNGNMNNNSGTRSVNTKIKTFYGETACLQLSYWNDTLSIKINPLMNVTPEGMRNYDFNRRVNTAITPEKAIAIVKEVEEKIFPKVKEVSEGKKLEAPVSVAFNAGNKGIIYAIEYKMANNDKLPFFYITAYTTFDADGNIDPSGIITHKFSKTEVIENFNTGKETVTKQIDAEFEFFFEKMKTLPDVIGSAAHSINVDEAYKSNTSTNNSGYNSNMSSNQSSSYSAPVGNFDASEFPFN